MNRLLKVIFFAFIIKPLVLIGLGLNVRGRNNLPRHGPAVIVANHNSHLDTMVLMSLYPLSMIHKVRPVAAADYFIENGSFMAWLSLRCIGIIPMDRSGHTEKTALFDGCDEALNNGDILILFPEGSRGEPEKMSELKKGGFHLLNNRPNTRVTPIMLHGLGRALPKGEFLFVPFNCDVVIGENVERGNNAASFIKEITDSFKDLTKYCLTLKNNSYDN